MMARKDIRSRFFRRERVSASWVVAGLGSEATRRARCSVLLIAEYVRSVGVYPVCYVLVLDRDNAHLLSIIFNAQGVRPDRCLFRNGRHLHF